MTAKSEMVYNQLLSLGGKEKLIVIKYDCKWQNYPAQFLIDLSVSTYTTFARITAKISKFIVLQYINNINDRPLRYVKYA